MARCALRAGAGTLGRGLWTRQGDDGGRDGHDRRGHDGRVASLVNELEAVGANYRIGVTTTDSGNPRCPSAIYTPEGGNLVLSSCLDRVDQNEFKFGDDDLSFACTDLCTKRDADLTVKGTATA